MLTDSWGTWSTFKGTEDHEFTKRPAVVAQGHQLPSPQRRTHTYCLRAGLALAVTSRWPPAEQKQVHRTWPVWIKTKTRALCTHIQTQTKVWILSKPQKMIKHSPLLATMSDECFYTSAGFPPQRWVVTIFKHVISPTSPQHLIQSKALLPIQLSPKPPHTSP